MKIAIAGASGFVGGRLLADLIAQEFEILALSRSRPKVLPAGAEWRETDLFSARSTSEGVKGAEIAIYLVHSMLPSSSLFQGTFHDTDLLLADNFARACSKHGVRRIIYLGGLAPEGHESPHLRSRREVEGVLQATGIPVTVLRAGMIVGPGGSSFEILMTLVRRLPLMILPEWTQRQTQAIFIDDVVDVVRAAVLDESFTGRTLDLVNGESLRYETLLRQMAETLGLRRRMFRIPIASTGFSKLWVTLFGNSNYSLVSPLIDSLLCELPASQPSPLIAALVRYRSFRAMAVESVKRQGSPRGRTRSRAELRKTVRSIQRLPSLRNHDCDWIATEYMRWLPGNFLSLLNIDADEVAGRIRFRMRGINISLLELRYVRGQSDESRKKFEIVGGWLSATADTGWLEFRQVQNRTYTLAAIHEFVPKLPWLVYLGTQAIAHRWTMKRFGRHLAELA